MQEVIYSTSNNFDLNKRRQKVLTFNQYFYIHLLNQGLSPPDQVTVLHFFGWCLSISPP